MKPDETDLEHRLAAVEQQLAKVRADCASWWRVIVAVVAAALVEWVVVLAPSHGLGAQLPSILLFLATVALVVVTWFYVREAGDMARSSRRATEATQTQTQLHQDELRYYYQPGLALQVHERTDNLGSMVKAFPTSQAPVFRVLIRTKDHPAEPQNMELGVEEEAPSIRKKLEAKRPAHAWTSARIGVDRAGWCLFPAEPATRFLVVRWEHTILDRTWEQNWTLTEKGVSPDGPPVPGCLWGPAADAPTQ